MSLVSMAVDCLRRLVKIRPVAVAASVALGLGAQAGTPSAALGAGAGVVCNDVSFQVGITPNGPTPYTMTGSLCHSGATMPPVIEVLLHGSTYDDLYWDPPIGGGFYSYVDAATQGGYATLALNSLGAGTSSHPASSLLTVTASAEAVHQVVTQLRQGAPGRPAFGTFILVGHSAGTLIAWVEIATYHDVDGLIVTGQIHA